MNKPASPIANSDFYNQEYISTDAFMEYLNKTNDLPYKSELSLDPFLNKLDGLAHGSCEFTKAAISPMFDNAQQHINGKKKKIDLDKLDDLELQSMLGMMFPAMFLNNQRSFIAPPFKKQFRFQTPATRELFSSGQWLIKLNPEAHAQKMITTVIRAGAFLLHKFYDINIDDFHSQVLTLKNIKTGLEKHCEVEIKKDFIEAIPIKPLKKLSKEKINELLCNIYDESLWLDAFPPENFEFRGFLIGTLYDVTNLETISLLKNKVTIEQEDMNPEVFFPFLEQQLKNYLSIPDLSVGMVMITYKDFFQGEAFSISGSNDVCFLKGDNDEKSIYKKAFNTANNEPILYSDLTQDIYHSKTRDLLLEKGIKSLILLPISNPAGNLSSIFEIGTPNPSAFNALTLLKLKEFFDLIVLGSDRYLQTMDSMIGLFIQQQFTSIHPSVEWRFEEIATKYEVQKSLPDFTGVIEPIVFKDIYPLYGQADIVSSSHLRNESIQADLIDNLKKVHELMETWNSHVMFHIMEAYILKVESTLKRLEKEFISSDESLIVELLTDEIHPLLEQLDKRYSELPTDVYQDYLECLDSELNIVYEKRKAYELSVSQLNSAISTFLEEDDQKMQRILPHYFEKYKTDGIEYNIYLGEAILKDGGFSPFFLKDFRIWQLVNACEITRLVEELSPKLPVPLKTAQLLFVYNSSLSIRFRMDEKQFDVDGTYNVRYEILKKRIDKAVIKGTNERLTVARKVAIVYLQEKDRLEYLEHLDYLVQKGYISSDIEDLELEKLQGAEGLKALRVAVKF